MTDVQTVGILGAGAVGTALARRAVMAGRRTLIASTRTPEELAVTVRLHAPGAEAVTVREAAQADVVLLAVGLGNLPTLDPAPLAGRVVVDVMNYWPEDDGRIPELEAGEPGASSRYVQRLLPAARVVKSLNHLRYHELDSDPRPAGEPDRRAIAVAGDDPAARALVGGLVEAFGFDAVDAGELAAGAAFEPGTPAFAGRYDRAGLTAVLAAAAQRA